MTHYFLDVYKQYIQNPDGPDYLDSLFADVLDAKIHLSNKLSQFEEPKNWSPNYVEPVNHTRHEKSWKASQPLKVNLFFEAELKRPFKSSCFALCWSPAEIPERWSQHPFLYPGSDKTYINTLFEASSYSPLWVGPEYNRVTLYAPQCPHRHLLFELNHLMTTVGYELKRRGIEVNELNSLHATSSNPENEEYGFLQVEILSAQKKDEMHKQDRVRRIVEVEMKKEYNITAQQFLTIFTDHNFSHKETAKHIKNLRQTKKRLTAAHTKQWLYSVIEHCPDISQGVPEEHKTPC